MRLASVNINHVSVSHVSGGRPLQRPGKSGRPQPQRRVSVGGLLRWLHGALVAMKLVEVVRQRWGVEALGIGVVHRVGRVGLRGVDLVLPW